MTQIQQPSQSGITAQQMLNGKEEPCGEPRSAGRHPPSSQPIDWQAYWRSQGQPWRTEPEIDSARQQELEAYRAVAPNLQPSIYPLKGVNLSRADVEWLLATHENGKGPVEWQDETQRRRKGLDLRGAVLSGDLRGLPLSRLQGGLARDEWNGWARASKELLALGAIDMEAADLFGTHLEGANLTSARLKQADLRLANLEGANLTGACLEGANLTGACLEGANLTGACLEGAYLTGANLARANLHRVQLKRAILFGTQLNDAYLVGAHLEGSNLTGAQLEGANLRRARLGRAILSGTLKGIDLTEAILADENGTGPRLVAVQWGSIDLSVVDWLQIKRLDDEYVAYQTPMPAAGTTADGNVGGVILEGRPSQTPPFLREEEGAPKNALTQSNAFKQAVRAYRQLALALRTQGLAEEAAYFSYQAHALYREVLRRQVVLKQDAGKQGWAIGSWFLRLGKYLFSSFLDLATGYGYKPWRSIIAYLLIINMFALAYSAFDHISFLPDALVLSLTGFHGHGFFPSQSGASGFMILIALEAIVGLLIEMSYIIVFTKRFLEQ
jgi:uncharacterized protein YjbI with pentapeptide repeats